MFVLGIWIWNNLPIGTGSVISYQADQHLLDTDPPENALRFKMTIRETTILAIERNNMKTIK